ncbi:hypothetical protein PQX77_008006 [Marasmius sp. AFHP31]|nr:hypothetical protein PQX77_008006 [Marasmius sp. AFHP31]
MTLDRKKVQLLNSRRNSLVPVGCLPTEVISRIFGCHVEEICPCLVTDDRPNRWWTITPNDWLWFTQVCQRWRIVALGTATLWSTPDFRFKKLSIEMMNRSRPAPLNVLLHVVEEMDIVRFVCKKVLRKEFSRIAVLDFHLVKNCFLRVFEEVRGIEEFPVLHSLTVFLGDDDPPRRVLALPHGLFAKPPPLRTLVLHNLDFNRSRSSGLLKYLTTLHLSLEDGFTKPLPLENLLSILEDCRELQELFLEDILDDSDPSQISNIRPIELPHLRQFDLGSEFSTTASSLCELVSFPNAHFIYLRMSMNASMADDKPRLRRMLERVLLSPGPPSRSTLPPPVKFEPPRFVTIQQYDSCDARGSLSFYPSPNSNHRYDAPISVCFQRDNPSFYDSMSILLDVMGSSGLARLEKLSICARGQKGIPVDIAVEYFGELKSLRHLVVRGNGTSARSLMEAIGREIWDDNDGHNGLRRCAFEALHTIRFEEENILSLSNQSQIRRRVRIGDVLVGSLRRRKEMMGAVGVESIVVDGPFALDQGELEEVGRLVPDTVFGVHS